MNPYLRVRQIVGATAVVCCALLPSPRLVGQDVTVTPPAWFDESNMTGDQPPELKGRLAFDQAR